MNVCTPLPRAANVLDAPTASNYESGQDEVHEAPSHLETSWFDEEEDAQILPALGQATIRVG